MKLVAPCCLALGVVASLAACTWNDGTGPSPPDCLSDSGPGLADLPSYQERLAGLAACAEGDLLAESGTCDGGRLLWIRATGLLGSTTTYYRPTDGRPLAIESRNWGLPVLGSSRCAWWPRVLSCSEDPAAGLIANCQDSDGDGQSDGEDNCQIVANPAQLDADIDGLGDACDEGDSDGDGQPDHADNCVGVGNPDQANVDADGLGDACDNCPALPNTTETGTDSDRLPQLDSDGDGLGDACDPDP